MINILLYEVTRLKSSAAATASTVTAATSFISAFGWFGFINP